MNSENVTALKERIAFLEQELQETKAREARCSQIMESNMVGVLFWHIDGCVLDANQHMLDLTGYSREDLVQGKVNWLSMTPPEYLEQELRAQQQLAEAGVCTPFEKEYIRKDGSRVPVLIGGAFLKGSKEEGVCFLIDVTERRGTQQRLDASQRLFQAFTDNSPAVAFIKDTEGRRLYLNRKYREHFQGGDELIGKSDYEMFDQETADRIRAEEQQVLASEAVVQCETKVPTPDGIDRTWLAYRFPVRDIDGQTLLGCVAVDISSLKQAQEALYATNEELEKRVSERTRALEQANCELKAQIAATQQAQQELRRSENRLRKWLEQSVVPIQVVSPDGWTVQVNPAWEKLWGVEFKEMEGRNLLADSQVEEQGIGTYIRRALSGEAVSVPEVPYVPDKGAFAGSARWCRGVIYPVKNEMDGTVEEIVIVHDDVTERRAVEERLREEERVMRNLLNLQEKERKLIAYEIHDGLVQELIGTQLLLDALAHALSGNHAESLSHASHLLRKAIGEARRLITGLRPLVIDERGVIQAIQYVIAEEEQQGGPAIHFFHRVTFDRLSPLLEGTLFRIVREAITNAKRHSRSNNVEIWLQQEGDQLTLRVRDYGCGFETDKVPKGCFGLESMRRRAQIFDGACIVESELGEGTTITVVVPLDEVPEVLSG